MYRKFPVSQQPPVQLVVCYKPYKGLCYCSPQRAVPQAFLLVRYKAVLLESSFPFSRFFCLLFYIFLYCFVCDITDCFYIISLLPKMLYPICSAILDDGRISSGYFCLLNIPWNLRHLTLVVLQYLNVHYLHKLHLLLFRHFLYLHSVLRISRTSSLTFPYNTFFRYFGINTMWYWHFHFVCDKLLLSIWTTSCD